MANKKTTAKAAQKEPRKRSPWNTAEILFSVFGYLTTREKPLIFSAHHDAAPIAEILGKIADANGLPKTRKDWKKIHIPEGLADITNMPKPTAVVNQDGQARNPVNEIFEILSRHNVDSQNEILNDLLVSLLRRRSDAIRSIENSQKTIEAEKARNVDAFQDLKQLLKEI